MKNNKIIIHLYCSKLATDSKDYRENDYDVRLIGLDFGIDARLYIPPDNVYGIIANPPCTDLAGSGARWWAQKGNEALLRGLEHIGNCLRIVYYCKQQGNLKFWFIENPIGRLSKYLGKPKLYIQPYEYGDPYTKKTCYWGAFNIPNKKIVKPIQGSKMHLYPPSPDRERLRSQCSAGFMKAFYEANK